MLQVPGEQGMLRVLEVVVGREVRGEAEVLVLT